MACEWDEYADFIDDNDELQYRFATQDQTREGAIDEIVEILEQQERDSYNAAVKDSLSQLDGTEETAVEYVLRNKAKEFADYANESEGL